MYIVGLTIARNEQDVIRLSVLHQLAIGVDEVFVVDNGSSDATPAILNRLSRERNVVWTRETATRQLGAMLTDLARDAYHRGATWVVPCDADEFWYAPGGSLRQVLRESAAGAVEVQVVNFIQRRSRRAAAPDALRTMTRRAIVVERDLADYEDLVEGRRISYLEMRYPPKWASRPSAEIEISAGNHTVRHVPGPLARSGDLLIFHAPLRSRATLDAKAGHGQRVLERGFEGHDSWHLRRFLRLQAEGALDDEWAANSYRRDALDVYGARHKVVYDPRLRDLLGPLMPAPWWRRLGGPARRLAAAGRLGALLPRP